MKRLYILTISFFLSLLISNAQNETDALRFSQVFPGGTARAMGMSGAFGAFGGDFSTLSINPAGIGVYRSSEFSFTPAMNWTSVKSQYLGNSTEDNASNFYMGNAGFVYSYLTGKDKGVVSVNFGGGYNRENNFSQNIVMQGVNNSNSLLDYFADNADGTNYNDLYPFEEGIAWDVYMIDTVRGEPTNYETVFSLWGDNPSSTYGQVQQRTVYSTGGAGEYVISLGMNLSNILYLGGTLGIHYLNYRQDMNHYEYDPDGSIEEFDYFNFNERLYTRGSAVGFKLGFLVKPIQFLRIGGAVHFPYKYKLSETYSTYIVSGFDTPVDGVSEYESASPESNYRYNLSSPFKAVGNIGFQIFKIAIIDLDLEYVNYSSMKLRNGSDGYDFMDENQSISEAYKDVLNIRAGVEFRLGLISLRAGGAYYDSPYADTEANRDADYLGFSGGIGYRDKRFFVDLAYAYAKHREQYFMYPNTQAVVNDFNNNSVLATIGFKF